MAMGSRSIRQLTPREAADFEARRRIAEVLRRERDLISVLKKAPRPKSAQGEGEVPAEENRGDNG